MDNVLIERLWRSVKHEWILLHDYETLAELEALLSEWIERYNHEALPGVNGVLFDPKDGVANPVLTFSGLALSKLVVDALHGRTPQLCGVGQGTAADSATMLLIDVLAIGLGALSPGQDPGQSLNETLATMQASIAPGTGCARQRLGQRLRGGGRGGGSALCCGADRLHRKGTCWGVYSVRVSVAQASANRRNR